MSRGRGKGSISQISSNLGLNRNEFPTQFNVEAPPPLYPPLDHQPLKLDINDSMRELLDIKEEILKNMQESPFHKSFEDIKKKSFDIARYTDKYKIKPLDIFQYAEDHFDWNYLPAELRPKPLKINRDLKKLRIEKLNIDEKLKKLQSVEEKLAHKDSIPYSNDPQNPEKTNDDIEDGKEENASLIETEDEEEVT
ncbi:unnamed protein product [Gordionus sp. m RMFG-2023]